MKTYFRRYGRLMRNMGKSGFTLIEVLIGLSILTVGILGVASMQISAIRGNNFSDSTTTALILAEQKMEDLLSKNYDDGDLNNVNPANDNNLDSLTLIDHNERVDENGETNNTRGYFRRIWNIDDDNPFNGNKTIRVIVTWPHNLNQHKVFLSSIKRQ